MTPYALAWLVAIGTAIWVGIDSSNLGMSRGRMGGGFLDMGPAGWVFACLLLWIVAFPCYLVARNKYRSTSTPSYGYGYGYGGPMAPAQYWGTSPTPFGGAMAMPSVQAFPAAHGAPPPLSPDGRWWWDGQRWNPMPSAPPQPSSAPHPQHGSGFSSGTGMT